MVWLRRVLLVAAAVLLGFAAFLADSYNVERAAELALEDAGYGEHVLMPSWHSHCAFDEATFTFISNSADRGLGENGYVCAGRFGQASVHAAELDRDELPDWEPF